jgi:aldehyde dehydrogenase (NAD+)
MEETSVNPGDRDQPRQRDPTVDRDHQMTATVLEQHADQETAAGLVRRLRASFESGRTRPLAYRQRQLEGLARFLKILEPEIERALHDDMGRPSFEAYPSEIALIVSELALVRRKLGSWTKPQRVPTAMPCQPGRSYIYREPLGVGLIIGPWNYPLQLLLLPLVGAMAAGNCVVLKPSELAPATSSLIATRLPEFLDPASVGVVEGGAAETTALLAERFDHIFFTGGETVGRIVMQAAAKFLTPVTLELGGKSPCIVDRHTDLEVAARRIVWGKFYNAGQTCVAPDYILAHKDVEEPLLAQMKQTLRQFFGDDPHSVNDYGRIINARHYERLMSLLPGSGEIVTGGIGIAADRYIAPTILRNTSAEAPVMAGEIFGPILPVLKVQDVEHAIAFVNSRPKPLALYVFTNDPAVQAKVLDRTTSGGVTVNHTLMHLVNHSLPFGGVGPSGMGAYHGHASFETFSHRKSVLVKRTWLDPWFFYPPYSDAKKRWVRRII